MSIRVAINGFGRIGRLTLRALLERNDKDIKIVAINDLTDLKSIMHLLKYDSLHYELKNNLKIDGDSIFIDDQNLKINITLVYDWNNSLFNKMSFLEVWNYYTY